jgi:hypothetical protein
MLALAAFIPAIASIPQLNGAVAIVTAALFFVDKYLDKQSLLIETKSLPEGGLDSPNSSSSNLEAGATSAQPGAPLQQARGGCLAGDRRGLAFHAARDTSDQSGK